ncbi:hypothetical protein BKA69DRAFT_906401 [Paraphysoderma sedebokerense]|nr:hypothetical protein BKA69DRAFT_906401 [Paraphysoderma sedebokerense]
MSEAYESNDAAQFVRKGANLTTAILFGALISFQLLPRVIATLNKTGSKNYYMLAIFAAVIIHATVLTIDSGVWLSYFTKTGAQQVFHKLYEFLNSVLRLLIGYVFLRVPSQKPHIRRALIIFRTTCFLGSVISLSIDLATNSAYKLQHNYDIFDALCIMLVLCYSLWYIQQGQTLLSKNISASSERRYDAFVSRLQQMLIVSIVDIINAVLLIVMSPKDMESVQETVQPVLLYLFIYILTQTYERNINVTNTAVVSMGVKTRSNPHLNVPNTGVLARSNSAVQNDISS